VHLSSFIIIILLHYRQLSHRRLQYCNTNTNTTTSSSRQHPSDSTTLGTIPWDGTNNLSFLLHPHIDVSHFVYPILLTLLQWQFSEWVYCSGIIKNSRRNERRNGRRRRRCMYDNGIEWNVHVRLHNAAVASPSLSVATDVGVGGVGVGKVLFLFLPLLMSWVMNDDDDDDKKKKKNHVISIPIRSTTRVQKYTNTTTLSSSSSIHPSIILILLYPSHITLFSSISFPPITPLRCSTSSDTTIQSGRSTW